MNQRLKSIIIIICVHSLLCISCDKHKAKRLSGIYDCTISFSTWNINDGVSDTSYTGEYEIIQDYKHLKIGNHRVHVDSVRRQRNYKQTSYGSTINVQFKKGNKLVLSLTSGGLGGGANYYITGVKR